MNETLYIEKLKKLRTYQDRSKGFLKGGLASFALAILWFLLSEEQTDFSRPYAVDEILSLTLGIATLFSGLLLILALVYFFLYRFTMRNYGTDMNQWMDALGEEGMREVFAGRNKHLGTLVVSLLLMAAVLAVGTVYASLTYRNLKQASADAHQELKDVFPDAEIVVDKWSDEYEISVTETIHDLYKNYDFEYILGTDYLDPYNQSYYASFYLSDFTADDILADLKQHIAKIQSLYYPPGTDMTIFEDIITDDFRKALQVAADEPIDDHSQEFRYEFDVNDQEVTIYLNIDIYNADNPEYHNITLSFYSYCWDD